MDNNTSLQKLRFRILECSSEDSQYPASELLTGSHQSKGWQSQRFCAYPQYITFQFLSPVSLKQLEFLFHEIKIPTKIELFIALPDLKSPLPYSEIKFKKLGYLALGTNENSSFQLRELKTIYIEAPCLYIRIVFHKCHPNKHNFFNQVGLISIIPLGEPLGNAPAPSKTLRTQSRSTLKLDKTEHESQIDELTMIKIEALEEAKLRAIENEEFDEAQRIKGEIVKLSQLGTKIKRLEDKKALAIQNEDFETAKLCKRDIDSLREALTDIINGHRFKNSNSQAQLKPLQIQQSYNQTPKESARDRPVSKMSIMNNRGGVRASNQDRLPTRTATGEEDEGGEGINEEDQEDDYQTSVRGYNDRRQISSRVDHDEQVIPALQNKNKANFEEQMQAQANTIQEAEELTPANQKLAEPLIPVIGKEICKKIFSKHWNLREDGLQTLITELPRESGSKVINHQDPWNVFVTVMGVISFTINDKVNQVAVKAMILLKIALAKKINNVGSKNELNARNDIILNSLLEKVGDNNPKTREQAEDVFINMTQNPIITCVLCVNAILKDNAGKNKGGQSARQTLGRLRLLQKIIQIFRIDNENVPYLPVVNYCLDKLENPNADVRTATINLLVAIYTLVGERILVDLSGVRPAQLEILRNEFNAASAKKPQVKEQPIQKNSKGNKK